MRQVVADIVVVGGGGAGLAAAIEAASHGATVHLLEKAPALKGSTGWSVGSITASGTPEQQRLGIRDEPAGHREGYWKFSGTFANRENGALVDVLVNNVAATVEWLKEKGLSFVGPFEEPPHDKPRLLVVLPNSMAYIRRLSKRARRLGVRVHLATPATRLVVESERVTAVLAHDSQGEIRFDARQGVILAGGDFSNSYELKKRFHSERYARYPALNTWNTGDAICMAEAVGAVPVNADVLMPPNIRFLPPRGRSLGTMLPSAPVVTRLMAWLWRVLPSRLVRPMALRIAMPAMSPDQRVFAAGVLVVSATGELLSGGSEPLGEAIATRSPEGAYLLFDHVLRDEFTRWPNYISTAPGLGYAYLQDYRFGQPHVFREAQTVPDLARLLGMDPRALAASVQQGAAACRTRRFEKGPFVALGPAKAVTGITDGGLRISPDMQVLRGDGTPIAGLYAAGATGQGGLLLMGHGHHLGWAFTSGRLAGRNAAAAAGVSK